jgi:hypothetical protein
MPTHPGQWNYDVGFEESDNVAVADSFGTGTATGFNNSSGDFDIAASDKSGRDFRAPDHGLIKNRGGHYLTYGGSDQIFLKGGPDIPENLCGYTGFDNTTNDGGGNKSGHLRRAASLPRPRIRLEQRRCQLAAQQWRRQRQGPRRRS